MDQYELEETYLSSTVIKDASCVYREMRDIKRWDKEVFVAFFLDSKNRVISREIVGIGILNSAIVHPREVFRSAISRNACSVIISHNHPSGDTGPSPEDLKITGQLCRAGRIIGIPLLDHVIVSRDGFNSIINK